MYHHQNPQTALITQLIIAKLQNDCTLETPFFHVTKVFFRHADFANFHVEKFEAKILNEMNEDENSSLYSVVIIKFVSVLHFN